jgi:hypothetical protein
MQIFNKKFNVFSIILILGTVGLFRNLLEVYLGIKLHPKWYVLDFDVSLAMFLYPIYLTFFGAFIIHITARIFSQSISYRKLFKVLFYLNLSHILIPPIDWVGMRLNIPWSFNILGKFLESPFSTPFLSTPTVMTLGVIIAWFVTFVIMFIIFVKNYKINYFLALTVLFISFNFIYWPVYHFWPAFLTWFDIFTMQFFPKGNVFGYSVFSFSFFLLGLGYYYWELKKKLSGGCR